MEGRKADTYDELLQALSGEFRLKAVAVRQCAGAGSRCTLCRREFVSGEMAVLVDWKNGDGKYCADRPACRKTFEQMREAQLEEQRRRELIEMVTLVR
ncbi:hypothetical protein LCGC14_1847670 [marine sediment metagenome]|uniref:Uncharacterized protein n=1 Tax=marine sediment metagenome TaxID=412755 RepID=A0A0F9GZJ7_9ZZZZ